MQISDGHPIDAALHRDAVDGEAADGVVYAKSPHAPLSNGGATADHKPRSMPKGLDTLWVEHVRVAEGVQFVEE